MKIYNTLAKEKQELSTITPNKVLIYVCGPTVYNFIHIGNARPMCVFDTLRRYLIYRGYEVKYVQNYTDVDDKIIRKSIEEGVPASEVSERYITEFEKDSNGLNIMQADVNPKVTENMDEIIDFVKILQDKGFAYPANGDVYFRTSKFEEYGKLSHMPLEDLEAGARIDVNDIKEDPMDFALWKAAKPSEPSWKAPWGDGRPGWHIECSAMVKKYLGDTIDIHCGGQDLIFPHHENEIAQSECANSKQFANYWMHNGYINVDNRKMSKSLNNFFTVRDVAKKYGYEAIRFLMLQGQYRSQINYTDEIIVSCVAGLERLINCKESMIRALPIAKSGDFSADKKEKLLSFKSDFINAMDDDLNTADAISAIFELVREINTNVAGDSVETIEYITFANALLMELCGVLGLKLESKTEDIPAEIAKLVDERTAARKAKDFALADKIRDDILDKGYLVEETRQGIKITKK